MRTKKPKKPFMQYDRTYNPEVEGYGDSQQWRAAFGYRMGLDAARRTVGKRTAREILGVGLNATWEMIKKAHRALAIEFYPEVRGGVERGDNEKFREVQAAFELLENEFDAMGKK